MAKTNPRRLVEPPQFLPDGADFMGRTSYVLHLASYLSDASTIRVRTLEAYGSAPSVERIRQFIAARRRGAGPMEAASTGAHEAHCLAMRIGSEMLLAALLDCRPGGHGPRDARQVV